MASSLKRKIDSGEQWRTDIWCHFGAITLRNLHKGLLICGNTACAFRFCYIFPVRATMIGYLKKNNITTLKMSPIASILIIYILFWTEEARKLWTVEEALSKLAVQPDSRSVRDTWLTTFEGTMKLDEKINLNEFLKEKTYSVHDTRHDLRFLTPSARDVRCKVK